MYCIHSQNISTDQDDRGSPKKTKERVDRISIKLDSYENSQKIKLEETNPEGLIKSFIALRLWVLKEWVKNGLPHAYWRINWSVDKGKNIKRRGHLTVDAW